MLVTEIEATGVQLEPETYKEWSIALSTYQGAKIQMMMSACLFHFNIDIQMKQKELIKTFMIISYYKKPFSLYGLYKIILAL